MSTQTALRQDYDAANPASRQAPENQVFCARLDQLAAAFAAGDTAKCRELWLDPFFQKRHLEIMTEHESLRSPLNNLGYLIMQKDPKAHIGKFENLTAQIKTTLAEPRPALSVSAPAAKI